MIFKGLKEGRKCLKIQQLKQKNEGISAREPVMTRVVVNCSKIRHIRILLHSVNGLNRRLEANRNFGKIILKEAREQRLLNCTEQDLITSE